MPFRRSAFRLAIPGFLLLCPAWLPASGVPPAPPAAKADDTRFARAVDAYAGPLVERGDLSGRLLVARGGTILFERSFGLANRELNVPITAESRFCVASVTKPMTLILALGMVADRTIGYRDSIARWLPDFPQGDHITIEHLLRHRSGIPHEIVPDSLATRPRTAAEMVALAARLPLDFPPGSKSSYSSGGFTVLARNLEIASGKSYATLLKDKILEPLGMTHTGHANAVELLPDRVASYVPGPRGVENAPLVDFSGLIGAGSVWSTPRDLHALVQAVVSGRFGPAVRQSLVRGGKLDFGGQVPGFRAYCDWDSSTGLEVVFAGNLSTGAPDLLRDAMPRLAAGESPTPPALPERATGAVAEETLRRYEGDFMLENGTRLRLRVHDGALWANDWLLVPTRDGAFYSPRDYGLVRGVAGADGRIERLDWTQRGTVYPAPRTGG